MGITWASPTKWGGRLDDCRSASPTASVAKCAVSEATKERVHANDVHAHIRPWARENPVTRGVAKLNLSPFRQPPLQSWEVGASTVPRVRRVGKASRKRSRAASVPLSSTDSGRAAEKHLVGSSSVAQVGGGRSRMCPINTHSLSAGSSEGDALNKCTL